MMSTRRLAKTWHGLVAGEIRNGPSRAVVAVRGPGGQPGRGGRVPAGRPGGPVGDLTVTTPLDIERGLLDVRPGQQVQVVIRREGQDQALPIEPQPLPRAIARRRTTRSGGSSA